VSRTLDIFVNERRVFSFERSAGVPGRQRRFFEQMDRDMDDGIQLDDEWICEPDVRQRTYFVVAELLRALDRGNQALAATLCAYLVTRLPQLNAVYGINDGQDVTVELDFD
jgi:hypothetical protein